MAVESAFFMHRLSDKAFVFLREGNGNAVFKGLVAGAASLPWQGRAKP